MKKFAKTDEYGIKEYPLWLGLVASVIILYTYIFAMSFYLLSVEQEIGNITTYRDAFWVLQMSTTTIGFGDFYPITDAGRAITIITFIVGMVFVGAIIGIINAYITRLFDNSIANRELRHQNDQIIAQNKEVLRLLKENNNEKSN